MLNDHLGGYQGSIDTRQAMTFLNEGKDEVWMILKTLNEQYFIVPSQATDSSADYYFGPLSNTVRQYTLPEDFREMKFIEVITQGYTDLRFIYTNLINEGFRRQRESANDSLTPEPNQEQFLYTIIGKDQFVMADFPPTTITLTLWYVRGLPDFEMSDQVTEILFPYLKKIAMYASKLAMASDMDQNQWNIWKTEWKDSVIQICQGGAPRNQSDALFVESSGDGDCW
jgi:hypothetical protein